MVEKRIQDNELQLRLTRTFQTYGYAGASLSILSRETGLKRASLYHRYPGGKEDMAISVIETLHENFKRDIFESIPQDLSPREQIKYASKGIAEFFENGHWSCLYDTMSLQNESQTILDTIHQAFLEWRDALKNLAINAGMKTRPATLAADKALIEIQGALVYSRITQDCKPFKRVIAKLPDLLSPSEA